jgi:hypothetical protein
MMPAIMAMEAPEKPFEDRCVEKPEPEMLEATSANDNNDLRNISLSRRAKDIFSSWVQDGSTLQCWQVSALS